MHIKVRGGKNISGTDFLGPQEKIENFLQIIK
jgi:hypothetical protein